MKTIFKSAALLIAAISIGFGVQSCASVKPIDKADLAGYWALKTLNGEDAKVAFEGPIPSLEFDFAKSMVAGSAGCNRYTSTFALTEQNLFTAKAPVSTRMACINANKEPQFLKAIGTPDLKLSLNKDGVLSFSQDKTVVLEFVKGEAPVANNRRVNAETLSGKWKLTSFGSEDLSKLFGEKLPTMEISADGKVFGNSGCNTYRGAYELKDNTFSIAHPASTMMACLNMEGENKFIKKIAEPLQVSINGNTLTFMQGGNVVLEFAKEVAE